MSSIASLVFKFAKSLHFRSAIILNIDMSFSFNFLPDEGQCEDDASIFKASTSTSLSAESPATMLSPGNSCGFEWFQDLQTKFQNKLENIPVHDWIPLTNGNNQFTTAENYIGRICHHSSSSKYKGTDLVPGVYEGGGVIWECSIDLCRYLSDHSIVLQGHVLELGCGHGLPGCWVLQQARKRADETTKVLFCDFNEFVLDATISNIAISTKLQYRHPSSSHEHNNSQLLFDKDTDKSLSLWLSKHTAMGAGDWNVMSDQLMQMSSDFCLLPTAVVPLDGKFDCILAAETTYSAQAAEDTARFVTMHLKDDGIAYIATKRYYFGVGGGSDAFQRGIRKYSSSSKQFQVETVKILDNGAGNIREILSVRCGRSNP